MINPDVAKTLNESVAEMYGLLYGLDLQYQPEMDKFQIATRYLNQALRRTALDWEWSYYSSLEEIGTGETGQRDVYLRASVRPRLIGGDAVQLQDAAGRTVVWAYSLPRDELSKYAHREGLWYTVVDGHLQFSRGLNSVEADLTIMVPVMREPRMFVLPQPPTDPEESFIIDTDLLTQPLDFDQPDLVIARAAYMYSISDPVTQPRAQTLEAEYKDLMYALMERDKRHTDAPYQNEWNLPIMNSIYGGSDPGIINSHPHADERSYRGW